MTTPHRPTAAGAVVAAVLEPRGRAFIDVGCGDGSLVRDLTIRGALAVGLEISDAQLARARQILPVGSETYRVGRAEALPFHFASVDAVVFSKSFHHIPMPAMPQALLEAVRVLRPGGVVIAMEPVAAGAYFELSRLIDDETEVRAAACSTLRSPPAGLVVEEEIDYPTQVRFQDVEHYLASASTSDPERRAPRVAALEAELRDLFARAARREDDHYCFDVPMRRHVLRRVA